MRMNMIDGRKGNAQSIGERLAISQADQEGPNQTGSVRDRDVVNLTKLHASGIERLVHGNGKGFQVFATGDFGDDTAVGLHVGHVREDNVGAQCPCVGIDNGGARFVAGSINGKDPHESRKLPFWRPIVKNP